MSAPRKRMLIVEDSEFSRDLLVQLFESAYELAVAADGETAVELASASPPDLILMDIGLPGMSGLDSVRAIRARSEDVPIIAVSSKVMPGEREQALAAGCDEFVPKPIDDLGLVEMVGRVLERR
jgi:two-component system, cell cycle response regulator DivK